MTPRYHLDAHDGEPVNVADFAATMVSFLQAFVRGLHHDPLLLNRQELDGMTALCGLLAEDLRTLAKDLHAQATCDEEAGCVPPSHN